MVLAAALVLGACSVMQPNLPPEEPIKPVPVPTVAKLPSVGLALGGGAARGFAHVGVLQVLDEAGIQLDLLRGAALAKYVNEQVKGTWLQAMPKPVGVLATQLNSGNPVLFQRGDAGEAVRASSAVPGVFMPVPIGGQEYVDGGLVAPVPVSFVKQMGAQLVIGVDISSSPSATPANDTLGLMLQTSSIMGQRLNGFELVGADVVVRPNLQHIGSANFAARKQAIAAGRTAMLAALPLLRRAIQTKTTWVPAK